MKDYDVLLEMLRRAGVTTEEHGAHGAIEISSELGRAAFIFGEHDMLSFVHIEASSQSEAEQRGRRKVLP